MRYRFRDCELDIESRELRRAGQPVPVEPQVFDLLRHLVEHAGIATTKDQIFDAVWKGRIVSDSALISRIKSARRAIGDTGHDQEMIKTLHGRGFRFTSAVVALGPAARPAAGEGEQSSEPDLQPSLTVRPLKDLCGLAGSRNLAEGMTSELVRLLSRLRWLKVVASEF